MSACVFAKVPLASARNKMMFERSDLRSFMTNKAGVSSLDLAFVHRPTHISERTIVLAYWRAPLSYQYTVCAFFYVSEKNEQSIPLILTLSNGALCHCTTLYMDSQLASSTIEQHIAPSFNYRFTFVYWISWLQTWMVFCCPL